MLKSSIHDIFSEVTLCEVLDYVMKGLQKLTEISPLYALCIRCLGSTSCNRWNLFPMVLTRAHYALVKKDIVPILSLGLQKLFTVLLSLLKTCPFTMLKNPGLFCWIMKDLWPNGSHFSSWQPSRPHSIAALLTGCGIDAWTNSSEDERTVQLNSAKIADSQDHEPDK